MVRSCEIPDTSLLAICRDDGAFTDCYVADLDAVVTAPEFIETFYTTWLFKLERALLARLARLPSTDRQAKEVADGTRDRFAAWRVESRNESQLLVSAGRTRSWFMVIPARQNGRTLLYFGSAVMPITGGNGRKPRIGALFRALLAFHKLYSRALLAAARRKLRATRT